ncbi:MAG: hypothetical protein KDN22_21320 [Verrucomicrobiae bacterium]|nr:hypothetical protein [Verrucomicrobiae bacterium]
MKKTIVLPLLLSIALIPTYSVAQLTRIIQTGDSIPDNSALSADGFPRHAHIDNGQVAFLASHEQFGASVPSYTLLYWDGTSLTRIADDDTPVPGIPGEKLNFNDVTDRNTVSIDGSPVPTVDEPNVLFYASYGPGDFAFDSYALYRWGPTTGLKVEVAPRPQLGYITPGVLADDTTVFQARTSATSPYELYQLSNTRVTKILAPGDTLPGTQDQTIAHIFPDFSFNGHRIVSRLNALPSSASGLWTLEYGTVLTARPLLTLSENSLDTAEYRYNTPAFIELGPFDGGAAATNGTLNGTNSQALVLQANSAAPLRVLYQRGSPTPGAIGYAYHNFLGTFPRAGHVVFAAVSQNADFDQIWGIYQTSPRGVTTIADTRSPFDGKTAATLDVVDRDHGQHDAILIAATFDDGTGAPYSHPIFSIGSDYATWIETEFPDANGNENIIGLLADPDKDSIPNLLEFALGGSAGSPDPSTTAPSITPNTFAYTRRIDLPDNITITPQISTSLASPTWQSGPAVLEEVSTTPHPNNSELTIVTLRPLTSPDAPAFLRLSIGYSE